MSILVVPLVSQGTFLGTLAFYRKKTHLFTNEEVEFLGMLGNHAAIAIHNSQLYKELQYRTQELSALHAVTSTASESLELNKVLNEVIRKVTEIFSFDATRIYLFNPGLNRLDLRASFETKPELFAQVKSFHLGEGNVGKVAESGNRIIFENIQTDPTYLLTSHTRNSQSRGFGFFAGFPIKSRSETVGTIVCVGQEPRHLNPSEIELITSMAESIGIAIQNSQLYEETKRQAAQLEEDIIRIKLLERQQLETEKLAATGRVAARVAHEINNPLPGSRIRFTWSRRRCLRIILITVTLAELKRKSIVSHELFARCSTSTGRTRKPPTSFGWMKP